VLAKNRWFLCDNGIAAPPTSSRFTNYVNQDLDIQPIDALQPISTIVQVTSGSGISQRDLPVSGMVRGNERSFGTYQVAVYAIRVLFVNKVKQIFDFIEEI
jgi:hypothetical protein